MSRGLSLYLDALRVLAAAAVLLSHWAYPRFTDGTWVAIRELNLGSDAVVLFFVLSGLVIAYTAETKDRSAAAFLFNRVTRIWSVAVPAVVLTFVLDRAGAALDPAAYDGWWYHPAGLAEQLWYGISASAQWIGSDARIGSNGPFWSLSYEVAYYLIFAAAVYCRGVRRLALVLALSVLAGPKVLLLAPVWLTGVAAWRAIAARAAEGGPARLSPAGAWALAVLPVAVYALALAAGVPGLLLKLSHAALGLEPARAAALLHFSDEFLWNWLIGGLAAVQILAVAALLRDRQTLPRIAAGVRWLAGASFSLYLVHYPLLQLLDAVLPEGMPRLARHLALLVLTVAGCLLFAQAFERPLGAFRARIRSLGGAKWRRGNEGAVG